jgi:LuxR family transcriptional regulator, maltose regulon positive regulatory protein
LSTPKASQYRAAPAAGARVVRFERRAAGEPHPPPFDVMESKVRIPTAPPGAVTRVALVNRLRTATTPIAVVTAPAGYGKTTLLGQWAGRDPRPFAWMTADERDDDPVVLLRHIAVALDRVEPVGACVLDALRVPRQSVWSAALPRLASALMGCDRPFVLVLDEADRVTSRESVEALAVLADHLPPESMLVLSGRGAPAIGVPRLRAGGRITELGADDLVMSRREAVLMLRELSLDVEGDRAAELVERTEGWPAGIYLTAVARRGDDSGVDEYLRTEHLSRLAPDMREFLRRTSVLQRMTGRLCDAVLDTSGSGVRLAELGRANLFILPLDRSGLWYRHHRLLRALLRRELAEHEPEIVPLLQRRAATWFEENGDAEAALEPALESGDTSRVAHLLAAGALPAYQEGRAVEVEAWLARFPDRAHLDSYPDVAVAGSWIHAARGRAEEAEEWLAAAGRGARRPRVRTRLAAETAVVRAGLCLHGAERMAADAEAAVGALQAGTQWLAMAMVMRGAAYAMLGDSEHAGATLAEAAVDAERTSATEARALAAAQCAMLALAEGDHVSAAEHSAAARRLVREGLLEDYPTSALALATSARVLLRSGRWEQAREDMDGAERLLGALDAMPWLGVETRLELAMAYVALRDADAARELLRDAGRILRRGGPFGVLASRATRVRREIDAMPGAGDVVGSGLTAAELRLLPLLATHLSFREIGERLFVSRNTIKTQAISVYRKLGVSSRSDAIRRAHDLGIIDAAEPVGVEVPV